MQVSLRQLSLVCSIALVLLVVGVGTALVHAETIVETSASTEISAEVQTAPLKTRPLQLLREKSMELKEKARTQVEDLKDEATEIRTNVRIDLKNASSGPERHDIVRDARTELKANLKERLQALFRTHLGSVIARLNIALQHFNNFVSRIESRIEKLQERGVDATSVEASLTVAVSAIATAEADVEALSSLVSSVTDASDTETVKAEIRATINKAVESVKAAHRALVATTKDLVALVRASATINSTTTVDTEE